MVGDVTEPAKPNRGRRTAKPLMQDPAALVAARVKAVLTPKQLADEAGISLAHLCLAEKGTSSLSAQSLKQVADVLGCQPGSLLNKTFTDRAASNQRVRDRAIVAARQAGWDFEEACQPGAESPAKVA